MKRPTLSQARRGVAATELALMLPVLCFICMVITDYGRLFYALATLSDSARSGALYYATHAGATSSAIQGAALADATNLSSPAPTITYTSGTDSSGYSYVKVTATYTFTTISPYPGIPSTTVLSRSVIMMPNP